MSVESVEAVIVEAIEKVKAEGWRLVPGAFGSSKHRTCCALGAVGVAISGQPSALFDVMAHLRIKPSHSSAIVRGFDGDEADLDHADFYALGARLRSRYVEELTDTPCAACGAEPTEPCADGCAAEQGEERC